MFNDIEKLSEEGSLIFSHMNSATHGYFVLWLPTDSLPRGSGIIKNMQLSDFGYITDAINECECIPFGQGKTLQEAYDVCREKYLKYFKNGYWLVNNYEYYKFLADADEIEGFIDFTQEREANYKIFDILKDIKKNINLNLLDEDD